MLGYKVFLLLAGTRTVNLADDFILEENNLIQDNNSVFVTFCIILYYLMFTITQ